ncbi:glutathione S-transferase N-terminal domain-containing protein [Novosphingobium colocasiae]|uniref:glutathione S-transferase N-terminal domain-containing protein n=1 Tax=Novosphingobium colocasiae TaxID=1256513 RepID=UPI0035B1380D
MIELHYVATANGIKVAIMLAELGIPYRVVNYDLFGGQHLTAEFRRINPNSKLPAIIDMAPADGGAPLPVFESGAVLLYLAEKTGRFLPTAPRDRAVAQQWLFWQMAGLGPMHGQAHHFIRYAPEKIDYAVTRYTREARRLLNVLDYRLGEAPFLAGEDYSIADMAAWPWAGGAALIGIDIAEFPSLARWHAEVGARPAVAAALAGKETGVPPEYMQERAQLTAEQWANTFGDRMHAAASSHRAEA